MGSPVNMLSRKTIYIHHGVTGVCMFGPLYKSMLICLVCIMCLVMGNASLFAAENNVQATPQVAQVGMDPWKVRSILIGFGNDNVTYGIARNNDDRLSYGARVVVDAPIWWTELDFEGYTNRGWRKDWTKPATDGNFYEGRYDVFRIGYGMRFHPFAQQLPSWLQFNASPYAGLYLAGNLGLVEVQNTFHKIIHRPYLKITYDEGTTPIRASAELSLDLSFAGRWHLRKTESGSFSVAIEASTVNVPAIQTSQEVGLSLNLLSGDLPVIRIWSGWQWMQSYTDWPTQRLMAQESTGPLLGFDVRAGLLAVKYYANPSTRVGYGIVSVDAGMFLRKPTWKASEVFITMGMGYSMGNSLHIFKFNTNIRQVPGLSIVTNVHYKGGPLDPKSEESDPTSPRKRSNNSSWFLSAEWQMPQGLWNNWVTPYVSAGVGVRLWDLVEHTNHIQDDSIDEPLKVIYDGMRPLVDMEIGVRIIPPGLIKAGNTTYQIELSAGATYVFATKNIMETLTAKNADQLFLNQIQPWMYRFSICLRYGIDL